MESKIYRELEREFQSKFDSQPSDFFFSPGRINLIGEHTDYNGGHVLPMVLQSLAMIDLLNYTPKIFQMRALLLLILMMKIICRKAHGEIL